MFIFARCLRSSAAVTPAKYEPDIVQVTTVLVIRKKWENNGTEKISLVTPTPGIEVDYTITSVLARSSRRQYSKELSVPDNS